MAIKELITIEGAEEVKRTIADLGKSGEDFIKKLNTLGGGGPMKESANSLNQYFQALKSGTTENRGHTRSVEELTTGYHILNLILREAGIQVGGFRALAMAAQTGVVGLGVAVTGSVLVALGKLSDAAAEVKQRLIDMVGPEIGGKLAGQFKEAEVASGSASGSMATASESLLRAVEASKNANGQWQTSAASLTNLSEITRIWSERIQLGKVNADAAAKSVNSIFQEMAKLQTTKASEIPTLQIVTNAETGLAEFKTVMATVDDATTKAQGLTLELFNRIEQEAPGLGAALSKAFGFQDIQAFRAQLSLAPKDIEEVISATLKMGPETDRLFENMDAKAQTAGQAAVKFKNETTKAFEDIAPEINPITMGMSLLADALATARKEAKQSADDVKTFNAQWEELIFDLNTPPPANWGADLGRRLDELIAKARELIGALSGGLGRGSGQVSSFTETPAMAFGGLFRGIGGVDNNLIRISDYEYIIRPEAVRKYGVRFLDWINSLQLPVRGFAAGGLVTPTPRMSIPSQAAASMQSNRSLTLVLDGKKFGVSGNRSTIDALEREAALRGLAATGISPGWVR